MTARTHWLDNDTHFLWSLPLASLTASLIGAALAAVVARLGGGAR